MRRVYAYELLGLIVVLPLPVKAMVLLFVFVAIGIYTPMRYATDRGDKAYKSVKINYPR
jgi:hypothetical protein